MLNKKYKQIYTVFGVTFVVITMSVLFFISLLFSPVRVDAEFIPYEKDSLYFDDIIESKEIGNDVAFKFKDYELPNSEKILSKNTEKVGNNLIKVYSGDNYEKINGKWWQVGYATTTKSEFDLLESKPLKLSLINIVNAQTYYPGSGDGYIKHTSWRDLCDTGDGITAYPNDATGFLANDTTDVWRAYFPFDTSGIGSDNTVASATLIIWNAGAVYDADDDTLEVIDSGQASLNTLVVGDFDNYGNTSFSSLDLDNANASSYNFFPLNEDGLDHFDTTGNTMFGIVTGREFNCSAGGTSYNGFADGVRFTEYAGTNQDPYLLLELASTTPPASGTSSITMPDDMVYCGDLTMTCIYREHYETSTTTADWYEIEYRHTPFYAWLFFAIVILFFAYRLIIEMTIRLRNKK